MIAAVKLIGYQLSAIGRQLNRFSWPLAES
jgi:hypothetical protein